MDRSYGAISVIGPLVLTVASVALLGGCGGPAPSPSATSAAPDATAPATGSAPPGLAGIRLRATSVQALPPALTFASVPLLIITDDGHAIVRGAVDAIYPGPLLSPLFGYAISEHGWAMVVAAAHELGLLSGETDFTGGPMAPGAAAGRIEMVVDGTTYILTGDPARVVRCGQARCIPTPGSPEAFAALWARFEEFAGSMGGALVSEGRYLPAGYGILRGPVSGAGSGEVGPVVTWPLATPLSSFGEPVVGDAAHACGTVSGTDGETLRPLFDAANTLTTWRDAAQPATLYSLTVRPILPGDGDLCRRSTGG